MSGVKTRTDRAAALLYSTMDTTSSLWRGFSWATRIRSTPTSVAQSGSDGYVFDAQSIISFRFPNNRIGNLEIVYSPELAIDTCHYAQDDRVEITGTKGIIWINGGHGRLGDDPPVVLHRDGTRTEFRDVATGWEQSFVLSTRHYIDILKNGGQPVLTADEARQVLRFALAAEQSARDRMAVDLDSGDE